MKSEFPKRPYRRGVCGKVTSRKKVRYALRLLHLRRIYFKKYDRIHPKLTYRAIANAVGVSSPTTVNQWDNKDMTEEAILRRLRQRAAPRKFTDLEERILCGWVIYKDLTLESSTTEKFREFAFTYFRRAMSSSYISSFMKRHHLSVKLVGNAKSDELRQEVIDQAVAFLEGFENLTRLNGLSLSQIKVMDKTYLQSSPWHKLVRHMSPKGSAKPRKITPEKGSSMVCFSDQMVFVLLACLLSSFFICLLFLIDVSYFTSYSLANEIWTTLCADGRKGPFFVGTKDPKLASMDVFAGVEDAFVSYVPIVKNPVTKKNVRPAERSMLAYLDYMINEAGFLEPGDFLLFDGELSFSTPLVQTFLETHGVFPLVIKPSLLHQLLSPSDNNFHAYFKLSYYRRLSQRNSSTISIAEKLMLAKQSYDGIHDYTIRALFRRCGLVKSNEDKRTIVYNLMFESIRGLNKHQQLHKNALAAYLKWCSMNNLKNLYSSLTRERLKMAGMIR